MKNTILSVLLTLLTSCGIDLDGLQNGLCGPSKLKCDSTQDCINGQCVKKVVSMPVDMGTQIQHPTVFPTTEACVSYYFPFYQSTWFSKLYVANGLPKMVCGNCTETNDGSCAGKKRLSKGFKCQGSNFIYTYYEASSVDPTVTYIVSFNSQTGNIVWDQVVGKFPYCSRGDTTYRCDTKPYLWYNTLCE